MPTTADARARTSEVIQAGEVNAVPRSENPELWARTLADLPYIPVCCSPAYVDYQLTYQRGRGGDWRDLSMVLIHDGAPCGVWPLSISEHAGEATITSHGLPIVAPLVSPRIPPRSRKTLVRACARLLDALCEAHDVHTYVAAESFRGGVDVGLSDWHQYLMSAGARASLTHELFVDLSLPLAEIRSRIRKSYRALISAGGRAWHVAELSGGDADVWEEFHRLHAQVAGRETRSAASWEIQRQAIVAGSALLVYLRDGRGRLVGGGYFALTRDEGQYCVAAYDRSLFDRPLGHVVQFRAIEAMIAKGLRWYNIGWRPYAGDAATPSLKEQSIGAFKQGFATHCFPRYELRRELDA